MELLAPAGNLACALAAFDNGADAVYAGLKDFNARARTENFTLEEFATLIDYARKLKRKVYLTLNTLIKESELEDISRIIVDINRLMPDAVIIQDTGILHLLRKFAPKVPIHASTQMAIHNSAGVKMASKLGMERVILERQVTLDEIKDISASTSLEIEVFVNGALCCGLSGACILSSWLGSWSGNRGKCKQACRRRYYGENGNGFFLSMNDLYTLDIIPKLKSAGVVSFKIEGRLKKPDYVANVVKAYRLVIDAEADDFAYKLPIAKNILSGTYARKWSHGFLFDKDFENIIQYDSLGVSGQLLGKVLRTSHNGFLVSTSKTINIDDRIRIQPPNGDNGPQITVTKISKQKAKKTKYKEFFIFCDKAVPENGFVFKIGNSYVSMDERINNLPEPIIQKTINLDISLNKSGLSVLVNDFQSSYTWEKDIEIQDAKNQPLSIEFVENAFSTKVLDLFSIEKINVTIEGKLFVPASVMKRLKKEFWAWALENIATDEANIKKSHNIKLNEILEYVKNKKRNTKKDPNDACFYINKRDIVKKQKSILVQSIFDFASNTSEVILPFFCAEKDIRTLKSAIDKAYKLKIRRFRVTSIYQFELLKDLKDIKISISFPLQVTNSFALSEFKDFNILRFQPAIELEKSEIEKVVENSTIQGEIYHYGRPPLLVTRAEINTEGQISDSRKQKFKIVKDSKSGLTFLYPELPMSIPLIQNTCNFFDYSNASFDEEKTSTFNYFQTLQ